MTQYPRTRSKAYVRTIPTQEQVAYAARRQAFVEARSNQQPSTHHIGTARFHPEEDQEGFALEEDESYYNTRLPTSARRYQGYSVSPEEVYQSGNTRYHVRYVDVPKRTNRPPQLPSPERYTDEVETLPKAKRHIHPLLYLGVGMLA